MRLMTLGSACGRGRALLFALSFMLALPAVAPAGQNRQTNTDGILPIEQFSPLFLGMYRKVMEIEDDIKRHAETYGVDYELARAVCLYESGGNPSLTSGAGAGGYFQVMPPTFRSLRVETNIEAGVKYLSQMVRQFDREDYALAAYNVGPGRVRSGRPPLETLQYVLNVGHFRSVLKLYEPSIRHHAESIELEAIREGDTWWSLAKRTGTPVLQLRMHNPFLATRALSVELKVAYPTTPRTDLFTPLDEDLEYRTRHGDNYLHLAFVLDVTRDDMRDANDLWRLQVLPAEQVLRIPLSWEGKHVEHTVQPGEDLDSIADKLQSEPWRIIRDNYLFWNENVSPGMVLKVRESPPKPTFLTYTVRSGDNLGTLADRHGTSVRAIQTANNMGRNTMIRIGQRLRIPTRNSG